MMNLINKYADVLIIAFVVVVSICWIGAYMEYVHHMFGKPL
jgi:hypothetical protein